MAYCASWSFMGIHDGLSWCYKGVSILFGVRTWSCSPMGVETWFTECHISESIGGRWIFCSDKDELEDLAGHRLKALINVEANKARVSRWYDKKVKAKTFEQGELVWKLILPIGTKSSKFGKWSPTWEGPFRVNRCVPGNAYILETLEGEEYSRDLNRKYLKKYYPSVWVDG